MPTTVSGAAMEWPEGHFADNPQDLASFRAMTIYNMHTDELALRLDVKVEELQHNEALLVGLAEPRAGRKISRSDPLINPNRGVVESLCVLADRLELARRLRILAEKLEKMRSR